MPLLLPIQSVLLAWLDTFTCTQNKQCYHMNALYKTGGALSCSTLAFCTIPGHSGIQVPLLPPPLSIQLTLYRCLANAVKVQLQHTTTEINKRAQCLLKITCHLIFNTSVCTALCSAQCNMHGKH